MPAPGSFADIFHARNGDGKVDEFLLNAMFSRSELVRGLLDPRRDINSECGYPESDQDATKYKDLFDREAIATRVVELMPKECWAVTPTVYESEDTEDVTAFEEDWDNMCRSLGGKSWYQDEQGSPVWEQLMRLDILAGIGRFGILLLGIDDGKPLDQPVDGVVVERAEGANGDVGPLGTDAQYVGVQLGPPEDPAPAPSKEKRKLIFLRAYDESLVQVTQYDANVGSPRFGLPVRYLITLNDPREQHSGVGIPQATVAVHWSRVIHFADTKRSSDVFGAPRMRSVLNRVLDLRKLYSGSAEMYWRGAFPGYTIETVPQLGGDVKIDAPALMDAMEQYMNGLQRYLVLMGMSMKGQAPQVVSPTDQINVQIEAICICLGCPVRVFKGAERGELASSQDDADWNGRVAGRQTGLLTPHMVVPFVDRLIQAGVLSEPEGYSVVWPTLDSLSAEDRATIASTMAGAISSFVGGGCEAAMTLEDFYTRIVGWDEAEAKAVVDAAREQKDEEGALSLPQPPQPQGAPPKQALNSMFSDEELSSLLEVERELIAA